jgi:hypothetical protein
LTCVKEVRNAIVHPPTMGAALGAVQ